MFSLLADLRRLQAERWGCSSGVRTHASTATCNKHALYLDEDANDLCWRVHSSQYKINCISFLQSLWPKFGHKRNLLFSLCFAGVLLVLALTACVARGGFYCPQILCRRGYRNRRYEITRCCDIFSIPADIPADALRVKLSWNSIRYVPANSFSHLSQCLHLDLCCQVISHIEVGAFNGLVSLTLLHLGGNNSDPSPWSFSWPVVFEYTVVARQLSGFHGSWGFHEPSTAFDSGCDLPTLGRG